MDVAEIQRVGRGLEPFLEEFSDCFGRCDTESYLEVYVEGQSSDLQRKSAEPIALRAGVVPRSLQVFLGSANWDEQRMIDRVQEIVARDHAHPYAIGLFDETGVLFERFNVLPFPVAFEVVFIGSAFAIVHQVHAGGAEHLHHERSSGARDATHDRELAGLDGGFFGCFFGGGLAFLLAFGVAGFGAGGDAVAE